MSYTQKVPNFNRFSILERTSTVNIGRNLVYPWESVTTVGGKTTTTVQPAGSLIMAELRCISNNAVATTEWYIRGGSFAAKACDQEPNELSTLGCNAYACSIANGITDNNIYITTGGVSDVNETLMTDSHAISYS